MYTMNRSGDNTQPCRSPTPTLKDFDLLLLMRTQTLEQWYSDLTATTSDHQCRIPATHPTAFLEVLDHMLFEVYKTSIDIFCIFPRLLKDLPERENLIRCAEARTKTTLFISSWFSTTSQHLFSFCIHFSGILSREMPHPAASLRPFLVYWDYFSCLPVIGPALPSAFNISGRISSQPAALPAFKDLIA